MNAPGWFSDEALRKRASAVPALEERAWGALGALMGNLLNLPAQPGPPYVHMIKPPVVVYTRSGKLLYWEKRGPAYTLTEASSGD